MTDATTGPGTGATERPDDDATRRRTVAPTPGSTEREAVRSTGGSGAPGSGRGIDRTGTAGRDTMPGEGDDGTHSRTVAPTPPEATDSGTPGTPGTPGTMTKTSTAGTTGTTSTTRLLPHEECDKLELRLRQAVSGFVDGPRDAVHEADQVVEEIAGRFAEAVTRRRRTLRMSWQDGGDKGKGTRPDTEQLRLALRDYRELAERLLHS